ncbi:hypothetical protein I546_2767 [Mycobacterium kansasii 732]|nr:hypothetical protein I546_2767 [Mycobacterium kansasii 732]
MRQAVHSDSKVPSCGNQPAHIRPDTRRYDTLDTIEELSGQRSGGHDDGRGRRFTLPT